MYRRCDMAVLCEHAIFNQAENVISVGKGDVRLSIRKYSSTVVSVQSRHRRCRAGSFGFPPRSRDALCVGVVPCVRDGVKSIGP